VSGDHAELTGPERHPTAPVAARVRELEERLIAAGLATDAEFDGVLTRVYSSASPVNGARMVARAWTDPGYRERLLADGNAAAAELGLPAGSYQLTAVANTPQVHNLVVCTLCSCYPTALLGPSPSWYKSFAYRSRAVREPRAVLAEFGTELPEDTEIQVWDANSESRYLVLPLPPPDADRMGQDELAALVTRGGLIGTAVR
jgi:nitrile hydratase subunit alpha